MADPVLKVLELFSGTATVSRAFREAGHKTITVDLDPSLKSDFCMDVDLLEAGTFLKFGWVPDIVWASPPCNYFSVLNLGKNWNGDRSPKSDNAKAALRSLDHLVRLIRDLKPKYYFIENPRGMMRKMGALNGRKRYTVTYCQYGEPYMKPTDIWTNCKVWKPAASCGYGDSCHVSVPRGSNKGIQGMSNSRVRAKIPRLLAEEIVKACEVQNG